MKIDIFTHIMPEKYRNAISKYSNKFTVEQAYWKQHISMTNHQARCRLIDEFEDMVQVLTVTTAPLEEFGPDEAADLTRLANDEVAELVAKYPEKYIAAVASLPLNNMDVALKEAERVIKELGFKGVMVRTSIQGKPLSSEEFMPLYEMMAGFDLPIWIHPRRRATVSDYPTENSSFHQIFSIFGWPFETSAAMTRLIFAGIFEKFPNIKFITHHCGGMIPYFADRIVVHYNNGLQRLGLKCFPGLTKHPIEYFRMFYNDTALDGNTSGLMCAHAFFGEDHLLLGSDFPFDVQHGTLSIKQALEAIEGMDIPESSKKKIYELNARNLLRI